MDQSFVLLVNGAVYSSESSALAYLFAEETLKRYRIAAVFFYEDGVSNALHDVSPASDEFDLVRSWQKLAFEHHFKLIICSAAGERRGAIASSLEKGFEFGALSDLAALLLEKNRLVQFK